MQTESRSMVAWRLGSARNDGKEELQRDIKKLSEVMDILIFVMSSWCVCKCVCKHRLLHVNYTSKSC